MASKILLVDDNPDDAELTRLALERHQLGSKLVHLVDGAQAIDYLFGADADADAVARDIRFIILDLKLPKVDGMQVLERIKSDPRTRAIPVVILSSSNQERDINRSFDRGVNSYVVKPVQLDQYMDAVSTLGRYWDEINQQRATA
ncbi:MAG: response regulator [Betaproteobacteria bacterium]|nr:response regulator [Betaproteobacteria bacterium]